MDMKDYQSILITLEQWVSNTEYRGFDPYDGLESPILRRLSGKSRVLRFLFIQFMVNFPINLREILQINPQINPKAIALFSLAYLRLNRIHDDDKWRDKAEECLDWLVMHSNKKYQGMSWGYPFFWQSRSFSLPKGTPSAVISGYVSQAFFEAYKATDKTEYRDIVTASSEFVLNELNQAKGPDGICFSYTPHDRTKVINASLLAASTIARAAYISDNGQELRELALDAGLYAIAQQNEDGVWPYSIGDDGTPYYQTDFHQGFVIDSLSEIGTLLDTNRFENAIARGIDFYHTHQFVDGEIMWRYPKLFPIDIHNQAQAIVTFSRQSFRDEIYLDAAMKVLSKTIINMKDVDGYFYYQRNRLFKNKINYQRWSQAWMMYAISELLCSIDNKDE